MEGSLIQLGNWLSIDLRMAHYSFNFRVVRISNKFCKSSVKYFQVCSLRLKVSNI